MVVLPMGYPRHLTNIPPNFNAFLNFQHVTKSAEQVTLPGVVPDALRRAFTQAKNGRPRPTLVEIPSDVFGEEVPEPLVYEPTPRLRSGPDPHAVDEVARVLLEAERPLLFVGQGVHYARAWSQLRELAELLEVPVTTSIEGKSAFPESHPLALGCAGRSMPRPVHDFLQRADLIFGIGCSFTRTNFGATMPSGPTYVHTTLDPGDVNKDVPVQHALVGDAALVLDALVAAVSDRLGGRPRGRTPELAAEIASGREAWLAEWQPKLTSDSTPLSPYRVIWDLLHTVDVRNTVITHDAGSPRDQLVPFWVSEEPLTYVGWGKTTQLGYGLGLAMGAKLACPGRLCVNVWGDAAIGFTGMDFETAVRERVPILSVLLNNSSMAMEISRMRAATAKYRSTDISGSYAEMARALGGYGERVTTPDDIVPAIRRGVEQTLGGTPALLEFITSQETTYSMLTI
jgi:acetolactate synthase-1/2/3 large subunit